jgi:hypothetical protein
MTRRTLLSLFPSTLAAREYAADIAVIGASTGGCAAALAALRNGMRVVMTEETEWVGGQMTSQAVSAFDEHPWIEAFGATRAYRDFRNAIRAYYRRHYPVTAEARARTPWNPGGGLVSNFACEPTVALEVFQALLAPYASSGQLTLLTRHAPTAADAQNDRVRAVTVRGSLSGREHTIHAPYFIDATELGDLLPLTRTEYVTGSEDDRRTIGARYTTTRQRAGVHRLLLHRPSSRRGSHHRQARRVRLLERLSPQAETRLAGQAAQLENEQPADPRAARPALRPHRGRTLRRPAEPVALPPHRQSRQLRRRLATDRRVFNQLAAERLLARPAD